MTSTRVYFLLVSLLGVFSTSQAAAQYPEAYPQQQPQAQPQPAQVPVTSMINQPTEAPVSDSPSIARTGGFRLNIQGYAGFAGSASVFFDGREVAGNDLAPTFGIQVQGLIPIGDYVLLGPAFSFRSLAADNSESRTSVLGIDAAVGGHYAIALGDSLAIDPYLLFTLGLAVVIPDDEGIVAEDVEFGLGFGFRAGATLWFADALGVSLDTRAATSTQAQALAARIFECKRSRWNSDSLFVSAGSHGYASLSRPAKNAA